MGVLQPHGPEPAASLVSMLLQQGTSLKHTVSACCLPALCQVLGCSGEGDKALAVSQRGTHPRQGQARAAGAEVVGPGGGPSLEGLGGAREQAETASRGRGPGGGRVFVKMLPSHALGLWVGAGLQSSGILTWDVALALPPLSSHLWQPIPDLPLPLESLSCTQLQPPHLGPQSDHSLLCAALS